MSAVPAFDALRQHTALRDELTAAMARCLDSGWYILGREVEAFEREFAALLGDDAFAVGVANGTDAIRLALNALDVPRGSRVATVPNTAIPTAMAIADAGCTPVFVDVDHATWNMDAAKFEAVTDGLAAVVPVHLYGRPADLPAILRVADAKKIPVVEDVAQAQGASIAGRPVGTWGAAGAFSFYPTKNMGAIGDGGLVATRSKAVADRLKRLRFYGQASRTEAAEIGINSRLDELQAAILRVKLPRVAEWNDARRRLAARYDEAFASLPIRRPVDPPGAVSVYHLYVIAVDEREAFIQFLREREIGTQIHYAVPLHLQPAFQHLGYAAGDFPVAEQLCRTVVSLPMFPEMRDDEIERVIGAVQAFFSAGG